MQPLPVEQIAALCRRYGATRLELFGSAANGNFGDESDYDFFVEFDDSLPRPFKRYMRLKSGLQDLLTREVDLVERSAVINKTFLRATDSGRVLIYAA